MLAVTSFAGKKALVFGLGASGLATAHALVKGGADVLCYDDNSDRQSVAHEQGLNVEDFRHVSLNGFAALILSPGVPLTHPEPHWSVDLAKDTGLEIIGDVELFDRERRARAPKSRFIAITGTNGKSTTSALIAHLLKSAGRRVELGGNIGRAVLSFDDLSDNIDYVIECSSYQIDLAPTLHPSIGVHLNISLDHLDRHGTLEHYASVKGRLVRGADMGVVGVDDLLSVKIAKDAEAAGVQTVRVSLQDENADCLGSETKIVFRGEQPLSVASIGSLRGSHNLQNAAIAVSVCRLLNVSTEDIQAGLKTFPGLAHRMEIVGQKEQVLFVNDSKATNADAAARALASFDRIYWIAGGLAKEGGIASLNTFFPKIVHAFLIGDSEEAFAQSLHSNVPFLRCGTLENATKQAFAMALADRKDSVVLLSPACASFDQFASFEARGDAFRGQVTALIAR